mmetsp:Transcript_27099/g.61670  ORF Transcript_27099/g.61670 Transcript_27099/m.61670 type:complete len:512 (-) Transcript_27099:8-1543(-)
MNEYNINTIRRNINQVSSLASVLKSSFGPFGFDKAIRDRDGNLIITNDGATILQKAKVKGLIRSMVAEMSKSHDNETGDGTTGVVLLTSFLLEEAIKLIENGVHPNRIIEGYLYCCDKCVSHLEYLSYGYENDVSLFFFLLNVSKTAMNSKIINRSKDKLSEITLKSVLAIADIKRRDVNFDFVKIEGKIGGSLENSMLINGIIIEKEFSHCQMPKKINDARICLVTEPLEPPKTKNKCEVQITNSQSYKDLNSLEQLFFKQIISQIKKSGANLLVCQWGFDDEGNHLLLRNKISAIRWVNGTEIELLSISTGSSINSRYSEINCSTVGFSGKVREKILGNYDNKLIIFENCARSNCVSILLRGGSEFVLQEAKRSVRDAMWAIRNMIKRCKVVSGGGSVEISCALKLHQSFNNNNNVRDMISKAFSSALKSITKTLAQNAGKLPLETISKIEEIQINENNPNFGVGNLKTDIMDMKLNKIYETLIGKQQQFLAATQMACSILRIDEIINN